MDKKKMIIYILTGTLVFLFSYLAGKCINRLPQVNMGNLRNYILGYGGFSSVIILILYILKPVIILFPTALLPIVAGSIYGPVTATTLSLLGCFLSATVAFCIARLVGKDVIEKIFRGRLINLDRNIERDGFKIILIMRLSIIFPYDTLSYAAGLTGMRFSDFILGTTIGMLPEMVAYSLIGENLKSPLTIKLILPILLIAICSVAFSYIFNFKKEKE